MRKSPARLLHRSPTMNLHIVDSRKLSKPHNGIAQAALALDENWFLAHPNVKKRVRTYRVGELGPNVHFSHTTRLLVIRVEPFVFIKFPVSDQEGGRQ